jgi:hypothetical protein
MANPKESLPNAAMFDSALRKVLRVSKSDLNQMLAEEKKAREGKPKPGPKPRRKRERT